MTDRQVLAEARTSTLRRLVAAALLAAVGLVLARAGLNLTVATVSGIVTLAAALAALWLALQLALAADQGVVLTGGGLDDTAGGSIVALEDIEIIDRGLLSARPSNGFVLRTRTRQAPAWRPGVWWRMGRRVGIGGILPKAQTKRMADRLALVLAERDQVSDQAT